MKIFAKLLNSAYCDVATLPPHEVLVEIDDEKMTKMVKEKFEKMGIELPKCKKCGAEMFFLQTKTGKQMPINLALNSHFSDCKFANEFRK